MQPHRPSRELHHHQPALHARLAVNVGKLLHRYFLSTVADIASIEAVVVVVDAADDDDDDALRIRIKNSSALLVVSIMHDDEAGCLYADELLLLSILSTTQFSPATSCIPGIDVDFP